MQQRCGHCIAVGLVLQIVTAVWASPQDVASLREEVAAAIQGGDLPGAMRLVQAALAADPDNQDIQTEYVDLHLSLARVWTEAGYFGSAETALLEVQRVAPDAHETIRLRREITLRQEANARQLEEIDRLLEYDRYFDARTSLRSLATRAGDDAGALHQRMALALLGIGDQYLLADAPLAAWQSYEHHLSGVERAPTRWIRRWAIALAMTTARQPDAISGSVRDLLRPRVTRWAEALEEDGLGELVVGFLDQADGRGLDAARAWSRALQLDSTLPPEARGPAGVATLEKKARAALQKQVDRLDLTNRPSAWNVILMGVWKRRDSVWFHARSHNDIVTDVVLRAATYHERHLANWLGIERDQPWAPRCELVVHADQAAMQSETGMGGATRAVARTRVSGTIVRSRRIHMYQSDKWLLSSTLPHELTHILVQTVAPHGLPLAIDEGLALQTEPPARIMQFHRGHPRHSDRIEVLLRADKVPADATAFYAQSKRLVDFLLDHAGRAQPDKNPRRALIDAFAGDTWYTDLGWNDLAAAESAWTDYNLRTTTRATTP